MIRWRFNPKTSPGKHDKIFITNFALYEGKTCSTSCQFVIQTGYSAQFSITAATELNTLCFTSTLIHYTSVGGDVINTKSAAINKSVPNLQMNLNFETYRKNITKIYDLSSVILY